MSNSQTSDPNNINEEFKQSKEIEETKEEEIPNTFDPNEIFKSEGGMEVDEFLA